MHNDSVLADLRSRGIRVEQQAAAVTTPAVMITAHGASQKTINRAREHGLRVIEATCPLVHAAHRAVARLAREGFFPVIIGKREHVEVRGMTEDLAEYEVVLAPEDIARLPARLRFGVVAQTTQPIDRVRRLVELLCKQFPAAEVRFIDTVCQPTKQRQQAADQSNLRKAILPLSSSGPSWKFTPGKTSLVFAAQELDMNTPIQKVRKRAKNVFINAPKYGAYISNKAE